MAIVPTDQNHEPDPAADRVRRAIAIAEARTHLAVGVATLLAALAAAGERLEMIESECATPDDFDDLMAAVTVGGRPISSDLARAVCRVYAGGGEARDQAAAVHDLADWLAQSE